jgi:hypothetical protein
MTEETTNTLDDLISGGFAALNDEPDTSEQEDNEVEQQENEELEQEEQEQDDSSSEDNTEEEAKPDKPLPKGKRAREEYEEKVRLKIENENLRKSLEILTHKKEQPAAALSDDDYLREKNIDPDTFIDDAAKAALVSVMKENAELKASVKSTENSTADITYNNAVTSTYNSLAPEVKEDLGGALNHLIETEAKALLIDYPNATIAEARKAAKDSLDSAMKQKYQAGVNPLQWAYQVAQARQYTPQLTSKSQTGKINAKKIEKSQDRAGSPPVDSAPVKTGGSPFSTAYEEELRALKVIR